MPDDMQGFEKIGPVGTQMGGFERTKPQGEAPQSDQPSVLGALYRGFQQGVGDLLYGAAQIGSRMGEAPQIGQTAPEMPGGAARVDAAAQQRAQAYAADPRVQAHPLASGIGRIGGNIAATAPLAAIPGGGATIPGRIAAGAAAGAAGAMMQPVTGGGDYWSEKAQQVGLGMAAGGALGGAGRMIGPPLSAAAQDVVSKFPYVAGIVRGTAIRSPDNFDRAVVGQVLDPIGVQVPKNLKAGHGLLEFAYDRLTDGYNKVLPKTSMMADPEFTAEIDALKSSVNTIPPAQEKQFNSIVENWLDKPLKNGVLDGNQFNKTISQLGTKINAYAGSSDGGQRELADYLIGVRESMLNALERQNPDVASELKNLRSSYAMYARIRAAANRRVDSQGVFTPEDLMASIRTGDKSAGKQQWATGGAMMQAMARATKGPMSAPQVNRIITEILGGALGFAAHGPAGGFAGTAAGIAGPEIARGMVRATQHPMSRALGRGVSGMAPAAGAYSATTAQRLKAARRIGDIQSDLYKAKRRGSLDEAQKLQRDLADANAEYRRLGGRAGYRG